MNDQATKSDILRQSLALIALASLLVIVIGALWIYQVRAADPYMPYTKTVLSLTGDPTQGHAIFQMNCAGCHGWLADGKVGPSLRGVSDRKSRISLVHQVVSGQTPPMPQFQPSAQEMADLLSYLESL